MTCASSLQACAGPVADGAHAGVGVSLAQAAGTCRAGMARKRASAPPSTGCGLAARGGA
jgi:hypothetical protein